MKSTNCSLLCLVLATLGFMTYAFAQPQASEGNVKAFVAQYVDAFNAQDASRLESLYDSQSQDCITAEDKDFYDAALRAMWRDPIPANYTFTVSEVNQNNLKAIETFGRFPEKPERELHIDYQQGDDSGTVIVYLVHENGRWAADQPCATEETLKQFRDDAPERKKREAHYQSLANIIQEPLRSQLIALLREHKTGEAVERYKKASGQDSQTAMFVMNRLAYEARP